MQRSLVQVVEQKQRTLLVLGLLKYIHEREQCAESGCPRLMLYPYIAECGLTCAWLHGTLRYLVWRSTVTEVRGHYRVPAYGILASVY